MAQKKVNRLVWTEPALADLNLIADYIALDNPLAAEKLVQRVFAAVERLILFPKFGRPVPELKHLPYRELVISPCRVIYRLDRQTAFIVLVIRGEQLLEEHRLWR